MPNPGPARRPLAMWDGVVRLRATTLGALAARHGGGVLGRAETRLERFVPLASAGEGDLGPVLAPRFARAGAEAASRGASLLVDQSVAARFEQTAGSGGVWVCSRATWTMAAVLDEPLVPDLP